jgi:hypothetical protein
MPEKSITTLVESFVSQITSAMEASMVDRIQAALAGALGVPPKRGPGRPAMKAVAGVAPVAARSAGKKARPKQAATPKVARARKLQGQYLGALKSLKGADRAKVKAAAKEKGVAEAVKLAAGMKKA